MDEIHRAKMHQYTVFMLIVGILATLMGFVETFSPPLLISGVTHPSMDSFNPDEFLVAMSSSNFKMPKAGDKIAGHEWKLVKLGADHRWAGNGVFATTIHSNVAKVVLIKPHACGTWWFNGEPHCGDVYDDGSLTIPILLHKGENVFFFNSGRGAIHPEIRPVEDQSMILAEDATIPILKGASNDKAQWGNSGKGIFAVHFINATTRATKVRVSTQVDDDPVHESAESGPIPALTNMKLKLDFDAGHEISIGNHKLKVFIAEGARRYEQAFNLRAVRPWEVYSETYVSDVDDSVQYYAVNENAFNYNKKDFVISLHGASVEALSQAQAYGDQMPYRIICPTNRRPFGYDWEGIGRTTVDEVRDRFTDPTVHGVNAAHSIFLTGHSMGGHGTWSVGVHSPGKYNAIAPSAGWQSFFTYVRGSKTLAGSTDSPKDIVLRASNDSDTGALVENLRDVPIYILHGEEDDNVPLTEALEMRKVLDKASIGSTLHVEPHAGHWWDKDPAPGADCLTWPGIFEMFNRSSSPKVPPIPYIGRSVDTVNPLATSTNDWLQVIQQDEPGKLSHALAKYSSAQKLMTIETKNVRKLSLFPWLGKRSPNANELKVVINGQEIPLPSGEFDGSIRVTPKPRYEDRNPVERGSDGFCGPFSNLFTKIPGKPVVGVVGTHGTPKENAALMAKARFDNETLSYRGNGRLWIFTDDDFSKLKDRGYRVLLYGNRNENSYWKSALKNSPIQVQNGRITVGTKTFEGSEFGAIFLRITPEGYPIGVVAATGQRGMVGVDRLNYFSPGVDFPDWTIFGPETLQKGMDGIPAAGNFGPDWELTSSTK